MKNFKVKRSTVLQARVPLTTEQSQGTGWKHRATSVAMLIFVFMYLAILPSSCDSNPYKQGQLLYENYCQNCHQENGEALLGLIPPLKNSDYLERHQTELPCIIRHGLSGEITVNGLPYNHEMPENKEFSEIEIANIINFVNNSWGNDYGYVSYDVVKETLEKCN